MNHGLGSLFSSEPPEPPDRPEPLKDGASQDFEGVGWKLYYGYIHLVVNYLTNVIVTATVQLKFIPNLVTSKVCTVLSD